jgi:hypothetical protein
MTTKFSIPFNVPRFEEWFLKTTQGENFKQESIATARSRREELIRELRAMEGPQIEKMKELTEARDKAKKRLCEAELAYRSACTAYNNAIAAALAGVFEHDRRVSEILEELHDLAPAESADLIASLDAAIERAAFPRYNTWAEARQRDARIAELKAAQRMLKDELPRLPERQAAEALASVEALLASAN